MTTEMGMRIAACLFVRRLIKPKITTTTKTKTYKWNSNGIRNQNRFDPLFL